jgi:hypothetical protein
MGVVLFSLSLFYPFALLIANFNLVHLLYGTLFVLVCVSLSKVGILWVMMPRA